MSNQSTAERVATLLNEMIDVLPTAPDILDAKSRRLVERTGTEIAGVSRNADMTLFLVNHNDVSFEAFGPGGRL